MSIQPFTGTQLVVLEKRTNGKLDFRDEQPPSTALTFDAVYQLFFRANPEGVGTWEALSAWLTSKGWVIRAKTW